MFRDWFSLVDRLDEVSALVGCVFGLVAGLNRV